MVTPQPTPETQPIEYDKIDPELVLIKLREILALVQRRKREKAE
jgi:hypothetical protein